MDERLTIINQNTLEALEEIDVIKIIERFTKTGMKVLSADFGFMFWKPENQNQYQLIYTSPETPYIPKLPRNKGYNHKAAVGKLPYFVSDPVKFVRPYMKSLAIIPIFYKKQQYGNIVFCFKTRRVFSSEEKPLMTAFGNSAAQVLTIHRNRQKSEKDSLKLLKQKDEFFNIASHELKTPVTTIKGFSEILIAKLGKSNPEVKYFLEKINKQTDKLSRLISDLLDVSRVETGKLMLENTSFELENLLKQTIESMQVAITSYPISFKSECKFWVRGDSHRLERVLINLITNAAKYSPPGCKIKVSLSKKDNKARIDVEDFGYGIPEKDREKVFNRFFQSEVEGKHMAGLGLGLYIAHSIVRHHGGTLSFTSKTKSKGTIFRFTLPYKRCRMNSKPVTF